MTCLSWRQRLSAVPAVRVREPSAKAVRLAGRACALLLLTTAGCQQILGLHERGEKPADGGAEAGVAEGGLEGGPVAGTCGQLVHPSAACASDPACLEASDCLVGCTDAACSATCAEFYAQPSTLIDLRACRVLQCAAACDSSCGELSAPSPDCQQCEQTSCCDQSATCTADADCAQLSLCISTCFGPASCPNDCEAQYPHGTADYEALATCTNQCVSSCQPGQSWACLDTVVWPKPPATTTIEFSVTFVTFTDEQPFVGSTVKACNKLDLPCSSPLAQSTTDATGTVTLIVPPGLNGFDGYLDVSGGKVGGTGAAVFPALWYPVPFVVADGARGRTELLAEDEFTNLALVTGTPLDPTRAHFAINAVDCDLTPAAAVSFSINIADSETVGYYLVGGVPATSTTATDQSGVGIFLNLPIPAGAPAGLAVVAAVSGAAGGKSMGSLSLAVRAGTLTTGSSFPPLP